MEITPFMKRFLTYSISLLLPCIILLLFFNGCVMSQKVFTVGTAEETAEIFYENEVLFRELVNVIDESDGVRWIANKKNRRSAREDFFSTNVNGIYIQSDYELSDETYQNLYTAADSFFDKVPSEYIAVRVNENFIVFVCMRSLTDFASICYSAEGEDYSSEFTLSSVKIDDNWYAVVQR